MLNKIKNITGAIIIMVVGTVIAGLILHFITRESQNPTPTKNPSVVIWNDTSFKKEISPIPDDNKDSLLHPHSKRSDNQQRNDHKEPDTSVTNTAPESTSTENFNGSPEQDGIAGEESTFEDVTTKNDANNQEYPVRIETSNSFIFKVTNCELSGNLLKVEMLITNIDNEKRLSFHRDTYFVDDNGYTYYLRKTQIGGRQRISANFPKDIPLRVTLDFKDINNDFKNINLFQLVCKTEHFFPVVFTDLYMQKK